MTISVKIILKSDEWLQRRSDLKFSLVTIRGAMILTDQNCFSYFYGFCRVSPSDTTKIMKIPQNLFSILTIGFSGEDLFYNFLYCYIWETSHPLMVVMLFDRSNSLQLVL